MPTIHPAERPQIAGVMGVSPYKHGRSRELESYSRELESYSRELESYSRELES